MTLVYHRILVAVDGSQEAEAAFKKSIGIAKRNKAILNIIHVIDLRGHTPVRLHEPYLEDAAFRYGQNLLEDYKKEALVAGVSEVNVYAVPGSPKKVISRDYAKQLQADLIVCGAQGLNALEYFLIGSVSTNIVRSSPCDVLVVRLDGPKKKAERETIRYE
ncbi:Putative universal stress protein [Planococcus massiliensis]|uniref:Universal stress protein n=1 Tax=Planococcus massiliensis TaxID=1499687 RepID=A0A098ERK2_9BACL|nr:universal stress protein [Planococcus massiliensis]CEG23926.1 Putative universal stress protein [Planococcus massiliensis]